MSRPVPSPDKAWMTKIAGFALRAALCLVLASSGCGGGTRPPVGAGALSVTDMRGRTLALPGPPRRVVCLLESALSGLYMLGAQDLVVGVPANVYQEPLFRWYSELDRRIRDKRLPAPGNWDFISIESVLALKPDLVIAWSQQTEPIAALEERGIPVYGVFVRDRGDVEREMEALGTLTGKGRRARELVGLTRETMSGIARRAGALPASAPRPSVYFMWAQGPLETSGAGSMVDDLIRLSGGVNVCGGDSREHLVVNMEQVAAWDPGAVVMWCNGRLDPSDILSDRRWQTVSAIREGRVFELPDGFLFDLWTLKYPYAVCWLASRLHPGLFPEGWARAEQEKIIQSLYQGRLSGG